MITHEKASNKLLIGDKDPRDSMKTMEDPTMRCGHAQIDNLDMSHFRGNHFKVSPIAIGIPRYIAFQSLLQKRSTRQIQWSHQWTTISPPLS